MDQIVVPQFLDVEDKIIGPITVRQFIELLIGGLFIFIFYKIFDFSLFLAAGLIVALIDLVIAFIKVNGQSFHFFLLNFITTMKSPKLKVWKKYQTLAEIKKIMSHEPAKGASDGYIKTVRPRISASRLSELALIVDSGGVYQGEDNI